MIDIWLDERKLKQAETILSEYPGHIQRALRPAFREGIHEFRETAKTGVTSVYAISRGNAQKAGRVKATYAETEAVISYAGNKISLHEFTAAPRVPVQRALVWGQQVQGGGGEFPHAFVAKMKSGHMGIFERNKHSPKYNGRTPIEEIMGVAEAQMVGRSDIYEDAERKAAEAALRRLDEQISAIINRA